MITYIDILWLFVAVIIHEIGHYLAFLTVKVKPTIKFTFYGINIGEPESPFITPIANIYVAMAGIIAGMAVIILFDKQLDIFLLYIILCMWDIVLILNLLKYWRSSQQTLDCMILELEDIKSTRK